MRSFEQNRELFGEDRTAASLVFTTAKFYMSEANLTSGDLDLQETAFGEVPWLLYRYNTSPGFKHSVGSATGNLYFSEVLESQFVRSVAIVSAAGVRSFLRWTAALYMAA